MRRRGRNRGIVALGIFVLLAVLAGGYEFLAQIRYDTWKTAFPRENENWFENFTVASGNEKLMWEYRPNAEYGNLKTNRYGFRDVDRDWKQKSERTYRIAFIGDTVTLGVPVDPAETFVSKFSEFAARHGLDRPVETMNFGMDGYNTSQILELLRFKVIDFQPDKIVYVMHMNDFDYDDASGGKIRLFRGPKSFLLEAFRKQFDRIRGVGPGNDVPAYHLYHFEKRRAEVFRNILMMRDYLAKRKREFVVVLLPIFPKTMEDYPIRRIHDATMEFLIRSKIKAIDLLDIFQRHPPPVTRVSYDVWHPNAAGHRLIARSLLRPVLRGAFDIDEAVAQTSKWKNIERSGFRVDLARLKGINIGATTQRMRNAELFQQRALLDGRRGGVMVEFVTKASFDEDASDRIARVEPLRTNIAKMMKRSKQTYKIEKTATIQGPGRAGNYALYRLEPSGIQCIHALTGYRLSPVKITGPNRIDTFMNLNYCAPDLDENTFAKFFEGLGR